MYLNKTKLTQKMCKLREFRCSEFPVFDEILGGNFIVLRVSSKFCFVLSKFCRNIMRHVTLIGQTSGNKILYSCHIPMFLFALKIIIINYIILWMIFAK